MGVTKNLMAEDFNNIVKDTIYYADTVIQVIGYIDGVGGIINLYADKFSPPTTKLTSDSGSAGNWANINAIIPAGFYYQITFVTGATHFIRRNRLI